MVPGASGLDTSERAIGTTHASTTAATEAGTATVATAPAPATAPLPPPPATVATAPAPAAATLPPQPTAELSRSAPPARGGRRALSQFTLGAGGGGWLGLPKDLTASFGLEVAANLFERVRLSLLLFGSSLSGAVIANNRGTLSVQSFAALLTGTLCGGERLTLCGGIAAGAQVTRGSVTPAAASQRLYQTRDDFLALPNAGLYGRAGLGLVRGLELSLDLAALVPFGSSKFTIEGFDVPAYTTAPVELLASLRLGWKFF
jgi:hypothetical protein